MAEIYLPLVIGRIVEFRIHKMCSQGIKSHKSHPLVVLHTVSPDFL